MPDIPERRMTLAFRDLRRNRKRTYRRAVRFLIVTAGLIATGAMFGGILGAVIWGIIVGPAESLSQPEFLSLGICFGAVIGGMITAPTAWLLLRRVPLGTAIVGTAAGTLAGALALLPLGGNAVIMGAITGFFGAAVVLRHRLGGPLVARARERAEFRRVQEDA